MTRKPRIAGLGISVIDYLALVSKYPEKNQKTEAIESVVQTGGPVSTAMVAAAKYGADSWLISVLGNDPEGLWVREQLQAEGVHTECLILDPEFRTPKAFIWIEEETGLRTIVLDRTRSRYPRFEECARDLVESADLVLTDGRGSETARKILQIARRRDIPTILDAGSNRPELCELLPDIDILIASQDFAKSYCCCSNVSEAFKVLRARYSGKIVITRGSHGLLAFDGFDCWDMPAYPVDVKDTTGAGDVWHGAFAAAYSGALGNRDFDFCLRFASVAAALSCRGLGGIAGMALPPEITEILSRWQP
jgi:sulfofructose kinase